MPILSRVYDFLRSRRLAAVLLVATAIWSALATVVPQRGSAAAQPSPARGLAAALGLDHAFSAPIFLALAVLLMCSTAACALERTRGAMRLWRRASTGDPRILPSGSNSDFTVALGDASEAARSVREAFREAGLVVRSASDEAVFATSARFGVWGSPVFHWLLVLLIAVIGAGQLTRAEGLMGVPVGSARLDTRESYGVVSEGPLHKRFTMLTVAVPSLELTHVVDGIDRGPTPYVELYDGPQPVASGYVFPNHPLRYKSLVVHSNDVGLAVTLTAPDGATTDVLLDFDEDACVARSASVLEIAGPDGTTKLELSVPLETLRGRCVTALPREPRVEWAASGPSGRSSGVVAPGERFEPLPGFEVGVGSVRYYARLSVADDWSVYPMYLIFALAAIALAIALFAPYREAAALIEVQPGAAVVHVRARHVRRDPSFARRLQGCVERFSGHRSHDSHKEV
ncbi:MAG: cytochrome c biogenesis protein ResB [Anaerosomatales bacterium]|nr:cytochrome c biogenesis protein ResB [Anaerosomatales bacterium]